MGRLLLITMLIYGYGDPGFDGHRPGSLDRPVRDFHRAVDTAARDAQRALVLIDNGRRAVPALTKLGDRLRSIGEALAPS
jgi:hypothetical protein